jgi:hypothetical protein
MYETLTGYPEHIAYAVGELDQAAQEAMRVYPEFAFKIRQARIQYEDAFDSLILGAPVADVMNAMPDVHSLIVELHNMWLAELLADNKEREAE